MTLRAVKSNTRSATRLLATAIALTCLARLYVEAIDSPLLRPSYLSLSQILTILLFAAKCHSRNVIE